MPETSQDKGELFINQTKVFTYVTAGNGLLLFRHADFPEAGIQLPAGTVEPGEPLEAAVLREVAEESGLTALAAPEYLGEETHLLSRAGATERHRRHFFHVPVRGAVEASWSHWERHPSAGEEAALLFEFFWSDLRRPLPTLAPGHDGRLDQLRSRLGIGRMEGVS